MKFGIVTYSERPMSSNREIRLNIGDPIQTYAMRYIYEQMGVENDSLIEISRYHAGTYDGEYVVLPYNCFNRIYNQYGYAYNSLPLSHKIIPIFYSFHLHSRTIDPYILNNLKAYEPIGCRDEETMINMRQHGILAYLSGCVTALLPRRDITPKEEKTFFVDVPESILDYIPENIKKNCEFTGHHILFERSSDSDYMTEEEYERFYSAGMEQLERYKKEATLVVTSRLHAAAPCMALGIPVILVSDNFDGRFSWIDKYLPLYTPDTFNEINWNPGIVDYEADKAFMTKFLINKINSTYEEYQGMYDISSFYEDRTKKRYNKKLVDELHRLPFSGQKEIKYAVWGLTTMALILRNVIEDHFKGWSLAAAIDKASDGAFEGVTIEKLSDIEKQDQDIIYFIIPKSAHKEAYELLTKLKRKFVLVEGCNFVYYDN